MTRDEALAAFQLLLLNNGAQIKVPDSCKELPVKCPDTVPDWMIDGN